MSRVYLLVLVEDAFDFFGNPMPAIRDGIIKGNWHRVEHNRARPRHSPQRRAGASLANRRWRHGYRQCGPGTTAPVRSASGEPVRPA